MVTFGFDIHVSMHILQFQIYTAIPINKKKKKKKAVPVE
jgi:hypothetical protein